MVFVVRQKDLGFNFQLYQFLDKLLNFSGPQFPHLKNEDYT